jgi:hypothetical protein
VPSNAYTPIDGWHVPEAAVAATLASVVGAGRRGDEAGVFWLGERNATALVRAVVCLRGRGVLESPGLWQVSSHVYGVVSRFARHRGLVLLATAHTHGRGVPVTLSGTDRRHGVRVPDFLALVIGDGGAEHDPSRWSWNVYDNGDFRSLGQAEFGQRVTFSASPIELHCASADGLVDWPCAAA